ncbi:hypothetical protein GWI33_022046 [Rhynchophorus ferrugineus]|uniref:Gustatory receptor n=1 Tax=Rhynchophorus ferrugineus TaxID=354439 RepID=A0A834IT43_RHYFE|nr:hypothetical protein GWI33_022046 [Rhynchophorus ferrugineus]
MCCDYAIREQKKIIRTCQELQKPLDIFAKRYQELEDFIEQLQMMDVRFTAFRCFVVDRNATIMLISVIANYFIVLVQFLN